MSKQNVLDFFKIIENDSILKQKLKAVANKEDLLKLAQELGYNFTAEDINAVVEKAESDELNEEELSAIAGGGIIRDAWHDLKKTAHHIWNALW